MGPDPNLLLVGRITYPVYEAMFVFNIFFILHNIFRYIIGLKMKETLIVLFYVILLLGTVLRAIEYCFKIMDPVHSFVPVSREIYISSSISFTVMILVEIILILTMYRLMLSLKLVEGKIDKDHMRRAECIAIGFTLLIYAAFLTLEVLKVRDFDGSREPIYPICLQGLIILLTLLYSIVIVMLNREMKNLAGDFD